MSRYIEDDYSDRTQMTRQKDLVLAVNEFCFLQNKIFGQNSLILFI